VSAGRRLIWLLVVGYAIIACGIGASFYVLRNDRDGTFELGKLILTLFVGAVALFVVEQLRARVARGGGARARRGPAAGSITNHCTGQGPRRSL
jgi:hypothetical protein